MAELLEHLGDLAADAHAPVGQRLGDVDEQVADPARRFEADDRRARRREGAERLLARRRPPWEEAGVDEPVGRQPRRGQRGERRRRSGDGRHGLSGRDSPADDHVARIVHNGCPGVADESNSRARLDSRQHVVGAGGFVVIVVTRDRCGLHAHPRRERAQPPGVFGQHEVDALEHAAGARREIVVVSDRERHDEQHTVGRRPDRAHGHRELGVARAEGSNEGAVDLRGALRRVVREGPASQSGTSPHHERVIAEEERADGRGEPVGAATGLQCHFDVTAEREQRLVVVIARHTQDARRPAGDAFVAGELEGLVVRRRDAVVATATKRHGKRVRFLQRRRTYPRLRVATVPVTGYT